MDGFPRRRGSKVHAMVTASGLPLRVLVGPAHRHDATALPELVEGIELKGRRGRPRTRPGEVCADGAYDSREIRLYLRCRGTNTDLHVTVQELGRE